MSIHPTAVVSPCTELGKDVFIGPYCVIEAGVRLEDNVQLISHVVIKGPTIVGPHTVIHPFCYLGQDPQHTGYRGEPTRLVIGAHNQIKEHVTIHRGTASGGGITQVGSHCFIMVGSHIAHDCQVGDYVIMTNYANIGGHVTLGNHVVLGGLCGIHQHTRIGEGAMVGGFSAIGKDIIPYGVVIGNRGGLEGINVRKLKRLGISQKEIRALLEAYEWIFCAEEESFSHRAQHLPPNLLAFPSVNKVRAFISANTMRPICTPSGSKESFKQALHEYLEHA